MLSEKPLLSIPERLPPLSPISNGKKSLALGCVDPFETLSWGDLIHLSDRKSAYRTRATKMQLTSIMITQSILLSKL
jgi:hypothetical protein